MRQRGVGYGSPQQLAVAQASLVGPPPYTDLARPRAHICIQVIDAHYSTPVDSILEPPFEGEFRLALGLHPDILVAAVDKGPRDSALAADPSALKDTAGVPVTGPALLLWAQGVSHSPDHEVRPQVANLIRAPELGHLETLAVFLRHETPLHGIEIRKLPKSLKKHEKCQKL